MPYHCTSTWQSQLRFEKCHKGTILELDKDDDTFCERMTEHGLDGDDIRRRLEEAKIDRVQCTKATEKTTVGKHFFTAEKL